MPANGTEVTQHVAGLRRYARAMVRDVGDADDAVQECLMRVLSQKSGLGRVRNMRAYLYRALRNVCIDRAIRDRRTGDTVTLDSAHAQIASPPTQYHCVELRDLEAALTQLPDDQRQVILLVGYEGMSYQDTAEALDIPIGTVMSRLFRGREALRQIMLEPKVRYLRRAR